jgi:hypothetical protein
MLAAGVVFGFYHHLGCITISVSGLARFLSQFLCTWSGIYRWPFGSLFSPFVLMGF